MKLRLLKTPARKAAEAVAQGADHRSGWVAAVATLLLLTATPTMALSKTISYADAVHALVAACGADITTYCKGIKPGGHRLEDCLLANQSNVSAQCKQTYSSVFASLAARAAAQAAAPRVCKSDAERLCSNFREGGARILRCLIRKDNVGKVTKKCNQAITEAGWR